MLTISQTVKHRENAWAPEQPAYVGRTVFNTNQHINLVGHGRHPTSMHDTTYHWSCNSPDKLCRSAKNTALPYSVPFAATAQLSARPHYTPDVQDEPTNKPLQQIIG